MPAASEHCKMKDENTTVRRRHDDNDTSKQRQQPQHQSCNDGNAEMTVRRKKGRHRRKETIRYNGPCGYYICYSIFVSVVGLTLVVLLLMLHLARCILGVSDKSVYDCFISLQLGHAQPRARTH